MTKAMDAVGSVRNFSSIPFDPRPPLNLSGVRLGTPAVTRRDFRGAEMQQIAAWMDRVATIRANSNADIEMRRRQDREIAAEVQALCDRHPAPGLAYTSSGSPL